MRKFALLFWLAMIAVCVPFLFQVSGETQRYKKRLTALEKEIKLHEEAVRILEADWSYLNRPERLSKLAARHLRFRPLMAEHFATLEQIPKATDGGKKPAEKAAVLDQKLVFQAAQSQGGA